MVLGAGDVFPPAALPDLEGVERPLAEAWAAGPAVVVIGHRDCRTSGQALPYVDGMFRRRGERASVTVVLQDDRATARSLVEELGLVVPVLLEPEPYRLARALDLAAVPTLFAVSSGGRIESMTEGFDREAMEELALRLGVSGGLFDRSDRSPAFRPG